MTTIGTPLAASAYRVLLLGSGEHLLAGLDLKELGYEVTEKATSDAALHVVLGRRSQSA